MKVYSVLENEKERKNYITKVKKKSDGTLQLKFANGDKIDNVVANEKNLKKIVEIQEKQLQKGIREQAEMVSTAKTEFCAMIAIPMFVGAIYGISYLVPETQVIQQACKEIQPYMITVGAIFGGSFYKSALALRELTKLKYRNRHLPELNNFKEYNQALIGISPKKARFFCEDEDPFSIINVDMYTKKDLKTVVDNINSEKGLQFTYKRKK